MESVRDELKRELLELGPRGRGRVYPKGLLARLLSYTVARRRQGATIVQIAAELGLKDKTLSRWFGSKRRSSGFERVEVVERPTAAAAAQAIIVHGPRGLRIEGLDLAAVADLVRRVGE